MLEFYKEMCSQIYEGESWDRMINCLERKDKEIERLNNTIKEVREKLLCYGETFDLKVHQQMQKELLEILDKEGK